MRIIIKLKEKKNCGEGIQVKDAYVIRSYITFYHSYLYFSEILAMWKLVVLTRGYGILIYLNKLQFRNIALVEQVLNCGRGCGCVKVFVITDIADVMARIAVVAT